MDKQQRDSGGRLPRRMVVIVDRDAVEARFMLGSAIVEQPATRKPIDQRHEGP
jgi:hypothetical protein